MAFFAGMRLSLPYRLLKLLEMLVSDFEAILSKLLGRLLILAGLGSSLA